MEIVLSTIIPTKDREKDLLECIDSISKQTVKPVEVLVIDDGQIPEAVKEKIRNLLSKGSVAFKYFKKDKPGLAESRNLGAKEAKGEVILFLDDDVILENDYFENLLKVWKKRWGEEKFAGVSGVIINSRKKSFLEIIFDKIFLLHSKKSWSILPWGFQTCDSRLKNEEIADWVSGCMASFRKEIFDIHQFKSLQPGRTGAEDIEFCWQLKNDGYYFIVTPYAKLIHNQSLAGRESSFLTGFKEGVNRKIMFKMHAEKSAKNYFCFYISSFGWVLRQFLAAHYSTGFGMIKGYLKKD